MKQERVWYALAFLCGVLIISVSGKELWNMSILSRYHLLTLSFGEINYEEYFIQILFLRLRTAIGLWIMARIFSEKVVSIGFACIMSMILGGIAAMMLLMNGIWGILFFVFALIPHGIFYIAAFVLWRRNKTIVIHNRAESNVISVLIGILLLIGCVFEAYISPILIENIVKY